MIVKRIYYRIVDFIFIIGINTPSSVIIYNSILPTTTQYSRNSIFSGLSPLDTMKQFPDYWSNEFESLNNIFEAKLSKDNTSKNRNYKILGLSENASLEEVSNQYRKLIKEYHPDKLQGMGLPKEFIELANQKLSAINKAYTEIKNDEKKNKL